MQLSSVLKLSETTCHMPLSGIISAINHCSQEPYGCTSHWCRLGMANGTLFTQPVCEAQVSSYSRASNVFCLLHFVYSPDWTPSGSQSNSKVQLLFLVFRASLHQTVRLALPFWFSGHEAHIACSKLETCVPFSFWLVNSLTTCSKPDLIPWSFVFIWRSFYYMWLINEQSK